jgi:uncharacterized membrane protein
MIALAACNGDERASPFGPVHSIDIALASGTLSMAAGESRTVDVSVSRSGGYSGAIALDVTGEPAGVTAAFDPSPVPGDASTLTLDAAPTTAPGTYQLTVTGSGAGVGSRTRTLDLTITAPPASPSIEMVLGASALTIVQGQSATVNVDVTRGGGYAGAVALTLSGAPSGLTHSFAPASLLGSATSTLTITASANIAPGDYQLTVTGSGSGVQDASATLAVTVEAAPPSPFIAVIVRDLDAVLSLSQGESDSWEVIVSRGNGYAGSVDLTIEGLPPNVSAAFNPSTLVPTRVGSLMHLTAGAAATPGTYTVTIRARGAGVADATVSIRLDVVAAGP